jgi:hypothetical protein
MEEGKVERLVESVEEREIKKGEIKEMLKSRTDYRYIKYIRKIREEVSKRAVKRILSILIHVLYNILVHSYWAAATLRELASSHVCLPLRFF